MPPAPPPLPNENPAPSPTVCALCGGAPLRANCSLVVCDACHAKLVARPIPMGIKAAALSVAVLLVVAFVRFPSMLDAAVHFERGEELEKKQRFGLAELAYETAAARFPHSVKAQLHLASAALAAGDYPKSARTLASLEGRQVKNDEAAEARRIAVQLRQVADKLKASTTP